MLYKIYILLAVGIGDGCKKLKCLLHGEKHYIVQCQLGTATDTYNETGKVVMEIAYGKKSLWLLVFLSLFNFFSGL